MSQRIPLISKWADPLLAITTGVFAHYLYEKDPKTERGPDQRVYSLIGRYFRERQEAKRLAYEAMDNDIASAFTVNDHDSKK